VLAGLARGSACVVVLMMAVLLIVLSNLFYAYGESLTAAFLPELARPDALGRVSGWGWSFGYFGGMLALGLSLAYVLSAQKAGQTATQFVPVTMWITAAIYGAAAIVTFVLLNERALPQPGAAQGEGLAASLARLRQTWRDARAYADFVWLMVCGFFYQAGIAVVIALAAVYAEQALGF
jgi:UMF1 family MFS transporter